MSVELSKQSDVQAGSGEMFDAIAGRYDLLNRVISLGIDQRWRRRSVESLRLGEQARVLDHATGTADLALLIARMLPTAQIVGVDPSKNMLEIARQKVERAGLSERIELERGSAEDLPFETDSFDGVTMAFGIRNVPDRGRALREMQRVTKPGGRVAILELSEPQGGVLAPLARFHVHSVVPWLGSVLSGAREYRYLQRSIAAFPPAEEFRDLMLASGFAHVDIERLTFGVCHLYVGSVKGSS